MCRVYITGAIVLGALVTVQACSSDPAGTLEATDAGSAEASATDANTAKDVGTDSSCSGATTLCSGACVTTATDLANCGVCGKACASGDVCSNGKCALSCAAGTSECNKSLLDGGVDAGPPRYCAALPKDPANCGACGAVCAAANVSVSSCAGGKCGVVSCLAGFGNCDADPLNGCETNTKTSNANCGACGTACAAAKACSNGLCCGPSLTGCGLKCVDTKSDTTNCGTCGAVCPGANGFCGAGTCQTFVTSAAPTPIPGSAACSLLLDTNAHQIDISPGGIAYVLLHCGSPNVLSLSSSSDGGKTFSAPAPVTGFGAASGAQIYARHDGELYVLAGFATDAQFTRSTDGGATWSAAVVVGPGFSNSGPGPSVTLAYNATGLFASWSDPTTSSPVYKSVNDGATWTALPPAPASGINYCPDLFFNAAGDLVIANEVARTVYKLPTGAAAWTLVGNLGNATLYTEFAAGGTSIFGTGTAASVERAPIDAFTAATVVSAPMASSTPLRSMGADSAGNLAFAFQLDNTHVRIHRWPAASATLDVGIDVTTAGTNPIPATVALPSSKGSITAVYSAGAAGIQVWTSVY